MHAFPKPFRESVPRIGTPNPYPESVPRIGTPDPKTSTQTFGFQGKYPIFKNIFACGAPKKTFLCYTIKTFSPAARKIVSKIPPKTILLQKTATLFFDCGRNVFQFFFNFHDWYPVEPMLCCSKHSKLVPFPSQQPNDVPHMQFNTAHFFPKKL